MDCSVCNGLSYLSVEDKKELMKKAVENYAKYGMTEPTMVRRRYLRFRRVLEKFALNRVLFIRFCFLINSSKTLIFGVRLLDIFSSLA